MNKTESLTGSFLIAMPFMPDPRFEKSVILLTSYSKEGATGILINKPYEMNINEVFNNMGIEKNANKNDIPVLNGGPVEMDKGFIIHNADLELKGSTEIEGINCAVNTTKESLAVLCEKEEPLEANLYLGYCGWTSGQLDNEIKSNDWLICNSHKDIIFSKKYDLMWEKLINEMGLNLSFLSNKSGLA